MQPPAEKGGFETTADSSHRWGDHGRVSFPRVRPLPIVVVLTGPPCAGKSTAASYLAAGFDLRLLSPCEIVRASLGSDPGFRALDDRSLQVQACEQKGADWYADQVVERLTSWDGFVIDAIHDSAVLQALERRLGPRFVSLHITAPAELRRGRHQAGTNPSNTFDAVSAQALYRDTAALKDSSTAVIDNRGTRQQFATQMGPLVLYWRYRRVPLTFQTLLDAVRDFHVKNDFEVGSRNVDTLGRRMLLMMEEVGEIARWATRQSGNLGEEHADVLILLLGNVLTMSLDLEGATVSKVRRIMARTARTIAGHRRVSHWGQRPDDVASRLDRVRLDEPPDSPGSEAADVPGSQLSLQLG